MRYTKFAGIIFLFLFFNLPAFAFDIPLPDGYVTDQAGIISESEEALLEARIQTIEDSTTAEIAILTITTTDGEAISQLAFDVGNDWGVGKKENDNGLIILVAVDDRAWFMATGYGLEGALPDAITKRIAENRFPAYFREGDYSGGLMAALNDIEGYLINDPTVIAEYSDTGYDTEAGNGQFVWFIILMIVAIFKSFWVGFSKSKVTNSLSSNFALFFLSYSLIPISFVVFVMVISIVADLIAIFGGKGGGGSSGSSSGSSWSSSSSSSSSWGSSSTSSGGSFGGGSFGGGGSGGKW